MIKLTLVAYFCKFRDYRGDISNPMNPEKQADT